MREGNNDVFVNKREVERTEAEEVEYCKLCSSPVVKAPGAMDRHNIRRGHVSPVTVEMTITMLRPGQRNW
jgi:cold shock CspA family protein